MTKTGAVADAIDRCEDRLVGFALDLANATNYDTRLMFRRDFDEANVDLARLQQALEIAQRKASMPAAAPTLTLVR